MKFKTKEDRQKQLSSDYDEQICRPVKYGQFTKSMRTAVANKELTIAPYGFNQLFASYGLSLDFRRAILIRVSQTWRYRDLTIYERPSGALGIIIPNRSCRWYSWFIPFV